MIYQRLIGQQQLHRARLSQPRKRTSTSIFDVTGHGHLHRLPETRGEGVRAPRAVVLRHDPTKFANIRPSQPYFPAQGRHYGNASLAHGHCTVAPLILWGLVGFTPTGNRRRRSQPHDAWLLRMPLGAWGSGLSSALFRLASSSILNLECRHMAPVLCSGERGKVLRGTRVREKKIRMRIRGKRKRKKRFGGE